MENNTKENDIIRKALLSLAESVNASKLCDSDKNALYSLLARITFYYNMKLETILKHDDSVNYNNKQLLMLNSFVTDMIVEINSLLTSDNDVYYLYSKINKKLNDNGFNKLLNSKKK